MARSTEGSAQDFQSAQFAPQANNASFASVSSLSGSVVDQGADAPVERAEHVMSDGLDDFGDFAAEPTATVMATEPETREVDAGAWTEENVVGVAEPAVPMEEHVSAPPSVVSEALSEETFAAPVESAPVPAAEPALNAYNSPFLQAFRAQQAKQLAEKEDAERLEIERIKEEAQAELELMDSQRAKQIAAVKAANRERQSAEVELFANASGWEAVVNLVSEENLVPESLTDLSKMKSLLRVLKNTPPVKA
jgi:hypothetical protein